MIVGTVQAWLRGKGQTTTVKVDQHGTVCTVNGQGKDRNWTIVCMNPTADGTDAFYYALGVAVASYSKTEPPTTVGLAVPDVPKYRQLLALLSWDVELETPYLRILLVQDGKGVTDAHAGLSSTTVVSTTVGPIQKDRSSSRPSTRATTPSSPKPQHNTAAVHPSMRTRGLPAQPLVNPVRTVQPVRGLDYDGLDVPPPGSQYSVLDRMPKRRR